MDADHRVLGLVVVEDELLAVLPFLGGEVARGSVVEEVAAMVDASRSPEKADAVDASTDEGSEFHHMHVPKLTIDAVVRQGSAPGTEPGVTVVTYLTW